MEPGAAGETTKKNGGMPPFFYLEKPRSEANSDRVSVFLKKGGNELRKLLKRANTPIYLYWDTFRHKFPTTPELTAEEKWHAVRQSRKIAAIESPVTTEKGTPFTWVRLPHMDEILNTIDLFAQGTLPGTAGGHAFQNRGLIEEAIASSQLEGAHTTRKVAKKMLLENRKPRNESELMILNNHRTMTAISENYKERNLSRSLLLELHATLTKGTVDPGEQHRFRKNADQIIVQGQIGNEIYVTHVPPSEAFVQEDITKLIAYANDEDDNAFIHPVLKAVLLHFWIGYLHPFTDGNGRLARSLFYWYLFKHGYESFMYLPVSTILKKVPLQYAMAYIYAEQDNQDVTYFLDFNLRKILQAITELEAYIDTKMSEKQMIREVLGKHLSLNDRQVQLVFYLISEADPSASVSSHARLHSVTKQTAIRDLRDLQVKGLVEARREGRSVRYYPTKKLVAKIG